MTIRVGRHTMLFVKNENNCHIVIKTMIFPIISKKNNQSLVTDAVREIQTLGSTDNGRNSLNLVSGKIR